MDPKIIWGWKEQLPQTFITARLKKDALCGGTKDVIVARSRVRIWMVSRFGDVGITPDLSPNALGYTARVCFTSAHPHVNPGVWDDWFEDVEVEGKKL